MDEESEYDMKVEEDNQSFGSRPNFAVVTLQDTDEVMVIASEWLNTDKTQCYWPPFRSAEKLMQAVKNRLEPSTSGKPWELLNILCHAEYDTYEEAVKKREELVKAQNDDLYAVITLQESNDLTVIPSNWLNEDKTQCYWPPFKSPEMCLDAIKNAFEPARGRNHWAILNIVCHGEYATYEHAKEKYKEVSEEMEWPSISFGSQSLVTSHGIKRKRDVSPTTDVDPRKKAKMIVEEINVKVQAIKSSDHTITTLQTDIEDAISKMDKVTRRKATVGIFGRSGEGKSSLLNEVLGEKSLLPSGCFGACTAVVTQVEANLIDSNYTAEIEFISKEEWEDEIALLDKSEDNEMAETIKERIIALYGADAGDKTLEELKRDDKSTEIDNILSTRKKIISSSDKIRECSSMWIVSDIKRAITDRDPWGILDHYIEDLGPGGECKYINFICTKTDDIKPAEYLRSKRLTEDQISGDNMDVETKCILRRNKLAKTEIKQRLESSKSKESKEKFITEVFTVSSLAYFEETSHLKPPETEIPKLKDFLRNLNKSINEKLTSDYVNEAKGVLSLIQSVQLDADENMTKARVLKDLQRNLEKELRMLDYRFEALHVNLEQCLSKGVKESVTLCLKTTNYMLLSVRPRNNRGFHKIYRALCEREGCYRPRNWKEPVDLNKYLTKHMYDNINKEFDLMFPVDDKDKTEKSMQKQVDEFNIMPNVFPTMLHPVETFIRSQETKLKTALSRDIIEKKKEIYSSICTTIQKKMAPGYKRAAEVEGEGSMERMEKEIAKTIEQLKLQMFNEAKVEVLNLFNELKLHIMKTLEFGLKSSVERSLSQTSKFTLMDVSREIEELERLSQQLPVIKMTP